MSGGGGSSTTTTQTIVPQFVQDEAARNIAIADQIGSKPYEANPFNIVAPISADANAAYDTIRNIQGGASGSYAAAENTLGGLLGNAKPITADAISGNVSSLMKPYSDIVIDPSLELMQQQLGRTKNAIGAQAANVGAFGGSRQGVEEGIADSQTALQAGQLKSGLLSQGFNAVLPTAANIETANQNLGQWATNLLPQVGSADVNQRIKEAAALEQAGLAQQGYAQNVADAAAAEFEMQRAYPIEMLQLREQALSSAPYGNTTQSTGPGAQSNVAGTVIGGIGAAASVAAIAI